MPPLALREICGYRSGDKGDIVNVSLFADDDETYAVIRQEVTAARVKAHFGTMVRGRVDRYEADNVRALNFVLHEALGGGGPRTLRADGPDLDHPVAVDARLAGAGGEEGIDRRHGAGREDHDAPVTRSEVDAFSSPDRFRTTWTRSQYSA